MTPRTLTLAATVLALGLAGCGSHDSSLTSRETHGAHASASETSAAGHDHSAATSGTASGSTTPGVAVGDHDDAARSNDIMFAQMMIPHHQQALVLADLALTGHGASAQVRDLATRIKGAQEPEIAQMKGWLTTWGAPLEMGHDMPMPGILTDAQLKTLVDTQGAAFDTLWTEDMIAHHEGAVTMAQDVLKTTKDPEVKKLADAVVAGQTKEIAEMRGALASARG